MLHGVGFSRRTYAEPARFAIFAIGSEVESDQRCRWFAAELMPNLGELERRTLRWTVWQEIWRHLLISFPAHAESKTANRIKSGSALCLPGPPNRSRLFRQ
jgi:hypothetical protein